jgi:DHA3 family macrolide efflux protein-like MFS transporter
MSETVLVQSQAKPKRGIRALSAHRSYFVMLAAKIISVFGDSVDSIAYSWMVYMLTGSKVLMGTLFAASFIPGIAFSPFTGVLVDRWSKKKVIVIAGIGRGITVSLTAFLYFMGSLEPWHLFVFTMLNSSFQCFSRPAEAAIVPRLLPKELLLTGNSITASVSRTAEIGGLAAAGGLIALAGISGTMIINASSFFLEALLYFFIRLNREEEPPVEPHGDSGAKAKSSYWKEFRIGLQFVIKNRLILLTMMAGAFVNLCLCPWNVLQPVYVKEILHSGPFGLSLLGITLMIGMILGGLFISQRGDRYKKSTLIVFGILLLGVTYSMLYLPALFTYYPLYAATLFSFGMGFAISFVNTPIATYSMEVTPKNMLGRISALSNMIVTCTIPLGGVIAGFAGTWLSANVVFLVFGLLMIIPGRLLLTHKSFMSI